MRHAVALAVVVTVAGCGAPEEVGAVDESLSEAPPTAAVHLMRDARKKQGSGGNLIDHGGKILSASRTYAIFWGNAAQFPSDARAGLPSLLQGFNGSSYLGIAGQYMRGAAISSAFVQSMSDSSAPPKHSPSTATIVNEACRAIAANGLTPDASALYAVFTSNFPHVNFCAWHDHGTCNGVDIQVAYMPNLAGIAGCDPGNLFSCNSYSQGTRALADAMAHEFMETVTDADLSAWYDQQGQEIGDKCNFTFSSCVSLSTGSWQLQEEWSNSAGGCVQQ
jgi:hypothetical protein